MNSLKAIVAYDPEGRENLNELDSNEKSFNGEAKRRYVPSEESSGIPFILKSLGLMSRLVSNLFSLSLSSVP